MIIRKVRLDDVKTVVKLTRDTIRNVNSKDYTKQQIDVWTSKNTARRLVSKIKDKSILRVVAVIDKKIVGVVCLKLNDNEIAGLYIKHTMHGRGIGSKLMDYIESYAKRGGLKYLKLYSTITAEKFYIHLGYKRIRRMTNLFGKIKIPCILLKKKL